MSFVVTLKKEIPRDITDLVVVKVSFIKSDE